MKSSFCYILLSLLQLLIFFSTSALSQQTQVKGFEYISPLPNSKFVSPHTNFIIRQGEIINETSVSDDVIIVTGSASGKHYGKLFLADDERTIIFDSNNPFYEGETVLIELKNGILTTSGRDIGAISFKFHISQDWGKNIDSNLIKKNTSEIELLEKNLNSHNQLNNDFIYSPADSLPEDLPNIYVTVSNNPSDGYIFIAPWFYQGSFFDPNYLMIVDNYGTPIYYKKNDILCLDFKLHPNGKLTYHDQGADAFIGMDSSYNLIDTFKCSGYPTDFHDIQLLDNGHYIIMGQDYQTVRMDTIVPGGDSAAIVIGQIVQEKDQNHNVVFQWRSWDHFLITDASDNIDLTQHTIDYVHANSIELDHDGNLIISCRNMNEVTKIDRSSGELIWRMGGKNNQFQFLNDPRGFTYQHDARILENGNITIFDNGSLSNPRYSTVLEYIMDEQQKTLFLDWNFTNGDHYSGAMGNSQRLANGNTLIGWGSSWNPAVTEVRHDGIKTFEIRFDSLFFSYRAFRFPWRTNLITSDRYRVDFEYVPVNSSKTKEIIITNNSGEELLLTSYFSRSSMFSVVDNFPITLQPFQNKVLQIQFSPDSIGVFSDDIHVRIQKENEMIAQVVKVLGYSDPNAQVELQENNVNDYKLYQNFPNPFNPTTTIKYQIAEKSFVTIKVYDVLGNEIKILVNEEKPAGSFEVDFDSSEFTSGIYFYQLIADDYIETKKMVLMK